MPPFLRLFAPPFIPNMMILPPKFEVGVGEGLKHDSAIYCDELVSFPKFILTDYVGTLSDDKIELLNNALRIALAIG